MKNKINKRFLMSFFSVFISMLTFGQLIPPSEFVHDTKGNIDVNGGGQLQFTLPIALPPGVKNVGPNVSLVYTNGSANGVAGYGWNISGISSISRTGRDIERDGVMKGIQLDYSDYYSFNGQRLILKSGEYGKDGAEYVTEKYSNTKFKSVGAITGQTWHGPEYWEVTFPDGTQSWYGAETSGDSDARTPLEYNIVKWKDAQGNYVTYEYIQDPGNHVAVISTINWGGNENLGKPHFNEIVFTYNQTTTRELIEQSYVNGVSLIQNKLLNHITVKTNDLQYKKYVITYKLNISKYQLVEQIQEFNASNEPSNPVRFYREEFSNNSPPGSVSDGTWRKFYDLTLSGDFRGIKITDFIVYKNGSGTEPAGYYMLLGNGFDSPAYYLGTENVYQGAVATALKDSNNSVTSREGFVSYSINAAKDITVKYYLIDLTKPIDYSHGLPFTYPNALTLVSTKYIPKAQWDESEHWTIPNPYNTFNKSTTIKKLIPYDIEGDGIPEILIEKKNHTTETWCTNQSVNGASTYYIPPDGDCETYNYDDYKYLVIKQMDPSSPFEFAFDKSENLYFGEFNGDGIVDIGKSYVTSPSVIEGETVAGNTLKGYNINQDAQGNWGVTEVYSADFSGNPSWVQLADFNGDGLSDLFVRTDLNDHYIINLNTGTSFLKSAYYTDFFGTENNTYSQYGNYSTAKVLDINTDGKSDIINFSTNYNIASPTTASSSFSIKVSENIGFQNGKIQFNVRPTVTNNYDSPNIYREVLGMRQNEFYIYSPTSSQYVGRINGYTHFNTLQGLSTNKIIQGGVSTSIIYNDNNTTVKNYYKPVQTVQYPLIELENVSTQLVSLLSEGSVQANVMRVKQFRYRGLIINLHNKKTVGFRQMASSSWNSKIYPTYNLFNTYIWSGTETDPQKEGVPVKEWSIRTNDESKVFPLDISENNGELLSFKSTSYQYDKLVNGQISTSISNDEKPFVVTAILPKVTRAKDFLTGTITENTVTYGAYYLPLQDVTKVNNTYAIKTNNYLYANNPAGIGADYYIGRTTSKTELVQAYNDSKSSKQELTYENNLIKTIKNWNRDNTGFTLDTFLHDDFGNITQKVSSNSIDSQTITTGYTYEPKGRFVNVQTDNLGLQVVTNYNDRGQILSKTDAFNTTVTNTFDGWGKILTSTTNLSGTATFLYERDADYNITVTENAPDGNVSKKFTNSLGQQYKVSSKAFEQGKFVSQDTQYDVLGRKIKESEPYFEGQSASQWNVLGYDDTVYPVAITSTAFSGKQTLTTISGLTTTVKEVNGYGRTTAKTVDALGNLISSTDKGGIITYSYNAAGDQIEAKYDNNIVSTQYDSWGRKSEFHDPSNGIYNYEYDGFGRAKKVISPKGEKNYSYNAYGQLNAQTELSANGGPETNKDIAFTYYPNGLVNTKSGKSNGQPFVVNYNYDTYGRLVGYTENSNGRIYSQVNTIYDNKGRVESYQKTLQSSNFLTQVAIENVYNVWNGALFQVKDHKSGKVLSEIKTTNVKGQVLTAKLGAADITNTYDSSGYLSGINHSSTIKPSILQLSYSFNAIKNELNTRITGGDFTINESFDYDDNNRLINWTNPISGVKPNSNRNTYDIKGRITQNDQVGTMKFENSSKVYQATGMTLNSQGIENYNNDLIQTILYNENNDPVYIDGEKGDVGFQYGLTSMRQKVTYGGNFGPEEEGNFTKLYSEDGTFEIVKDNTNSQEKHILYVGGTPYETNIVFLKNYQESEGSYKFLHKDYLGSILAISDESGNKLEQRHFDAWGNFTHLQIGNHAVITGVDITDSSLLLLDRGYTGHEHFVEVGIVHMNGRLYDPLLRRFLNADENIQEPTNTQSYNKYGYVMNNPMMYNDPSGEFWGWLIGAIVGSYISGVQANHGQLNPVKWDWQNSWTAVVGGAFAGAALGQGITNINVNGSKMLQNSVVGAVGSIFNGLANGQNIFKSALTGFSGVSYSFNIGRNSISSTDVTDDRFKYIISPDYNQSGADPDMFGWYMPLTKEIYAQYVLGKGRGQLRGTDENYLGHMFEKVFIDWAQFNIGPTVKDNTIGRNYYGTVPDATSPLATSTNYVPDGVFYEVKNTFRNIGLATAQVKREMNALSINNLTYGVPGGVMIIASPAGVNLTGPLMGYARNLNIDLVQFFSIYRMEGSVMRVRFITTSTINLFNTTVKLGGTSVPAYKTPN
ncbi:type IV secretion protein Rhs [Sphingobacterium sp. Ag1]|uniref:RHS repeat-associated core domain-containing protein n=1 Tax=Sphingobacterium sp. Ag1 TaxID=1643451 RepID=UPI00062787CD|nr:RHS repeat-associated core domain-containing protein [Sphingobacterium sp. Ag1]KKO89201.1 type IV secretion protein Rhs [Sphingobacterium sp. Ag1]